MDKDKRLSKQLSYVLRHKPESIGVTLDAQGWAKIDELLPKLKYPMSRETLDRVVRENDKKRFSISLDGKRIRANQGHSIAIDLGLAPATPPDVLYHGTATRFLDAIFEQGLVKKSRQHVHLSLDTHTANKVGARHGKVFILRIDSAQMAKDGYVFFRSDNGVWLTDHVPVKYLSK